jgi:hypothetical protein
VKNFVTNRLIKVHFDSATASPYSQRKEVEKTTLEPNDST